MRVFLIRLVLSVGLYLLLLGLGLYSKKFSFVAFSITCIIFVASYFISTCWWKKGEKWYGYEILFLAFVSFAVVQLIALVNINILMEIFNFKVFENIINSHSNLCVASIILYGLIGSINLGLAASFFHELN